MSGQPDLSCRFGRLVTGSAGYTRGNCLVCFSEQVAARKAGSGQNFALFLLNKFHRIFLHETMPEVHRLLGTGDRLFGGHRWLSEVLSPAENYAARCACAAAHESFHQAGPRPLRDHLRVKMNWFCGVLEEIKVDAKVIIAARDGRLPYPRGHRVHPFRPGLPVPAPTRLDP